MLEKKILSIIPESMRTIRSLSRESLDGSLTIQQIRVLYHISEGRGQCEMADIFHVSEAAMSKMINSLVTKKFILREPLSDRRRVGLKLTFEGKKVLKVVSSFLERTLSSKMKKLTPKELSRLDEGLDVLKKIIGFLNEN